MRHRLATLSTTKDTRLCRQPSEDHPFSTSYYTLHRVVRQPRRPTVSWSTSSRPRDSTEMVARTCLALSPAAGMAHMEHPASTFTGCLFHGPTSNQPSSSKQNSMHWNRLDNSIPWTSSQPAFRHYLRLLRVTALDPTLPDADPQIANETIGQPDS